MRHPGLHGAGTGQNFWDKNKVIAKLDTDDTHACDKSVVHDLQCLDALGKRLLSQLVDFFVRAVDQGCGDVLHKRFGLRKEIHDMVALVVLFKEFVNFFADKLVGYITDLSHAISHSGRAQRAQSQTARGISLLSFQSSLQGNGALGSNELDARV